MKYILPVVILLTFFSCKENALEYNDNLVLLQETLIQRLDEVSQYQQSLEGKLPSKDNHSEMMKKVDAFSKTADSCNEVVKDDSRFSDQSFHKSALNLFERYTLLAKSLKKFYTNTKPYLLKEKLNEEESIKLISESNILQQSVDTVDKWENIFITEQAKFAKEHKFQLE